MPGKVEGLLDHGRLENVNLRTEPWKPSRTSRWSFEFARPEFFALRSPRPKGTLRKTAWLDGLRGFAALLVYFHHNILWSHGGLGNLMFECAYGFEGRHYFGALPFIRLFFSGGHFAVAIFFVISGYVLSIKSLGLVQKGQLSGAADTVGSALFRRWLRLYLPIIIVTFSLFTFRHATKMWMEITPLKSTYREEVREWYYKFKNYSFVFCENIYEFPMLYHAHVWSIPIEFKGSIIIYTTLQALSKCTKHARLMCEVGLIVYFLYIVDGYYGAMFICGMLLCDLDLLEQDGQLPRIFSRLAAFKEFIFFHLFIIALYLGGVPSYDDNTGIDRTLLLRKSPGWKWLSYLKPQAVFDVKWFFLFWAAAFTVASIPRLPWLKRFFETRFCQYLARISFALYLMHGVVIWTIGDRLYAFVGFTRPSQHDGIPQWINKMPLSQKGPKGLEPAFWIPQLIILPTTLYVAELVTKLVDEPCVKFANNFYKKTLAPPTQPQPLHKRSFSSAC